MFNSFANVITKTPCILHCYQCLFEWTTEWIKARRQWSEHDPLITVQLVLWYNKLRKCSSPSVKLWNIYPAAWKVNLCQLNPGFFASLLSLWLWLLSNHLWFCFSSWQVLGNLLNRTTHHVFHQPPSSAPFNCLQAPLLCYGVHSAESTVTRSATMIMDCNYQIH